LIRLDTTNPPGNETLAAEFLADTLSADGISTQLLAAAPSRANVLARVRGSGVQAPLLLLGHTDVVYADEAGWSAPPFAGVIREGYVWGRGALDMKGLLTMQVMALRLVKRAGLRLNRDVLLLASADEEDTGRYGAGWVVDHHWDRVASSHVFGEGGVGLEWLGHSLFLLATAEKGYADLALTARGNPGHASMSGAENALVSLAKAIQRIASHRSNVQLTEPVVHHLAALTALMPWPMRLAAAGLRVPWLGGWLADRLPQPTLRNALRNTFTPTVVRAGRQANVVPDSAEATLNCRLLPGVSATDLLAEVRAVVRGLPVDVAVTQFNAASVSPAASPFFGALERAVRAEIPAAVVAPYMMPGATDARFFRARGVTAYGLMPVTLSLAEMATIHGVDERIGVADLERGTRTVLRAICELG
jgi:acetylornithine deacetylase/succinyl-diaminopimelate desuccinylase-like protein